MNRHGISLNPTREESARLRQLWRGDAARRRTQSLIDENAALIRENERLRRELAEHREDGADR